MVLQLHGGSIDVHKGNYYLSMGIDTDHPSVSGLNAHGGINMHGHSISNCNGIGNDQGDLNLASSGKISISPGTETWINNTLSGIVVNNGSGNMVSLSSLIVSKQGNGAQLGNLWVGDHVINDSSGSQIDMYLNLDLYSASGKIVRANGTQIGGTNSTKNIKQNIKIRDTHDVLNILKKIKIYDYDYIKDFYDGQHSYGYIIDELEQIPELDKYVHFVDNTRNKKYPTKVVSNQEDWIKFLLACIIELQKKIDK